jgi:tetrahedral aminopeptidase
VLAVKHAKTQGALRVMLAAHMDEVGFMIVSDDENGLFSFEPVGGMDERQLAAKPVQVGPKKIPGVIGSKPIHLSEPGEMDHAIAMKSMKIDVSPANAGSVKVGDFATFATKFFRNGDAMFGKALDDRLGVVTLIELMRVCPPELELLFAFTVQEEIGLRGARIAGFDFKPDLAFVVDSTPALDFPPENEEEENSRYNCKLGLGPAIYLADAGTLSDPRLIRFLVSTAGKYAIPFQFRQPGGGGTDAGAIHLTRSGVPTVSISIPGRYAHSAVLLASQTDWANTLTLLHNALLEIDRQILSVERHT